MKTIGTSATRRAILLALLREGPLAPDTLATRVGLSRTAVLHQLRALAAVGLVTRTSLRHGVGRPRHLYDVTAQGQGMIDSRYPGLSRAVVEGIRAVGGPELEAQVLDSICQAQVQRIRRSLEQAGVAEAPLRVRLDHLVAYQASQGFMGEVTNGAALRLHQRTCPFYRVLEDLPTLCDVQLELLRDALDASVSREASIASGDRCCVYRIEPAPA